MKIIAGKYRGRKIETVDSKTLRPTAGRAKEAIFNILSHGQFAGVLEEATVLDVFSGTGALGLEALSRGAAKAIIIEKSAEHMSKIKLSARNMGADGDMEFIQRDACGLLPPATPSSVIFMDPPYKAGLLEPALNNIIKYGYVADNAIIVAEVDKHESFKLPQGVEIVDERSYGTTKVVLLEYNSGA